MVPHWARDGQPLAAEPRSLWSTAVRTWLVGSFSIDFFLDKSLRNKGATLLSPFERVAAASGRGAGAAEAPERPSADTLPTRSSNTGLTPPTSSSMGSSSVVAVPDLASLSLGSGPAASARHALGTALRCTPGSSRAAACAPGALQAPSSGGGFADVFQASTSAAY